MGRNPRTRGIRPTDLLERPQEIQDVLLIGFRKFCEIIDYAIRFRALTRVLLNRIHQVASSSVVQKEQPLPGSP